MKRILLLVSAVALMVSCNKAGSDEYIVSGTIKGLETGKVFIEKQDSLGKINTIDTAKIEKGKFTFKGKTKAMDLYLIQIENVNGKVPFVMESGDIDMKIEKDSLQNAKVTGTYNNDELSNYVNSEMKVGKEFQKENKAKIDQAQQTHDMAIMTELQTKFMDASNARVDKYLADHPKSFLSALLLDRMFYQQAPDVAKIKKYYDKLDKTIQETRPGKAIRKKLDAKPEMPAAPVAQSTGTAAVGSPAPDFSAPTTAGKMVSLKESMGKVTIIDFWASWCQPCRRENPNVVAMYNELHAKGLNIIGVSLDKDATAWKDAIAKDKLTWNQISNLKFWDEPIAATYGVQSIPATFLLDAQGNIVAKDLTGPALKAKVNELLAAK